MRSICAVPGRSVGALSICSYLRPRYRNGCHPAKSGAAAIKEFSRPRAKPDSTEAIGLAVAVAGTVLLILGLSMYARAKGHSPWWCLMGVLSIIGLIVLAALPDRLKSKTARPNR